MYCSSLSLLFVSSQILTSMSQSLYFSARLAASSYTFLSTNSPTSMLLSLARLLSTSAILSGHSFRLSNWRLYPSSTMSASCTTCWYSNTFWLCSSAAPTPCSKVSLTSSSSRGLLVLVHGKYSCWVVTMNSTILLFLEARHSLKRVITTVLTDCMVASTSLGQSDLTENLTTPTRLDTISSITTVL